MPEAKKTLVRFNVQNIKFAHTLICRTAMDGSKAGQSLPEGTLECYVKDPVKAHLVLCSVKKSCINKELFICKVISCEAPGETEKYSLSVLPNIFDFVFFHSAYLPFLPYFITSAYI